MADTNPALSFDFGTPTSPLAPGHRRVSELTRYDPATGYGWSSGEVHSRDAGLGHGLTRAQVYGHREAVFTVDVPAGDYAVTLVLCDLALPLHNLAVFLNGVELPALSTVAGEVSVRGFRTTVTAGRLDVLLSGPGGFVLNGLRVAPVA